MYAAIYEDSGHRASVWSVTPAKAGVQSPAFFEDFGNKAAVDGEDWIPAFAGMTLLVPGRSVNVGGSQCGPAHSLEQVR